LIIEMIACEQAYHGRRLRSRSGGLPGAIDHI
jgi:hypothetical protein